MCPFCGLDPYEYVDVGIGSVPVAVNCCEYGWLHFDGGEKYGHSGMPLEEVEEIYKQREGQELPKNPANKALHVTPNRGSNSTDALVDEIPF